MEDTVLKNPFYFHLTGFLILFKIDKTIWPKMKKTMEKNMNRMDDWIEARLMNAKKNKSAVSTKDVIAEISGIFNLKTSRQSIRRLKEKIKTVRNRVNKKCARQKQTCERYARKLFVPNEMIQRWVENGLFPIQNPRKIERIMTVIEERDYFREALSNKQGGYIIPIEKGSRLIK
jgi:hypothetical protein